jgi:hypothetical protein
MSLADQPIIIVSVDAKPDGSTEHTRGEFH